MQLLVRKNIWDKSFSKILAPFPISLPYLIKVLEWYSSSPWFCTTVVQLKMWSHNIFGVHLKEIFVLLKHYYIPFCGNDQWNWFCMSDFLVHRCKNLKCWKSFYCSAHYGCANISTRWFDPEATVNGIDILLLQKKSETFVQLINTWEWCCHCVGTVFQNICSIIHWYSVQYLQSNLDCYRCDRCIKSTAHDNRATALRGYELHFDCDHCGGQSYQFSSRSPLKLWVYLLLPGSTLEQMPNNSECICWLLLFLFSSIRCVEQRDSQK